MILEAALEGAITSVESRATLTSGTFLPHALAASWLQAAGLKGPAPSIVHERVSAFRVELVYIALCSVPSPKRSFDLAHCRGSWPAAWCFAALDACIQPTPSTTQTAANAEAWTHAAQAGNEPDRRRDPILLPTLRRKEAVAKRLRPPPRGGGSGGLPARSPAKGL